MNVELKDIEAKSREATNCLKALAHESRLLAICYIFDGEKSVQEIEQYIGTSQSNISQHLGKLRDKGILDCRKDGNQVFYHISDLRILDLVKVLKRIYCD